MKIRTTAEKWSFVILVSLISVGVSVVLTALLSPNGLTRASFLPSFLVPLCIAPAVSLWAAHLILRVHALNVQLEHLLAHDYMTGLANRRAFLDFVKQRKTEAGGAVLILDIDRFKSVNDTYGHHVGDQVIQMVARVLKQETGSYGKAARLGGEEFGVFFPRLTLSRGLTQANQIREAVENQRLPLEEKQLCCTLSVGVDFLAASDDIDTALQRADQALYDAKNAGRNRVVSYRATD